MSFTKSESASTINQHASKRHVPTDLSGQPIPQSKRWVYSPPAVANRKLSSNGTSVILVAAFVSFDSSSTGHRFYEYLEQTYGVYNVNVWGAFIITSTFFWIWSAVFAVPDLTGWPRWLFKYKTQPFVQGCHRICNTIFIISLLMRISALPAFSMHSIAPIGSFRKQCRRLNCEVVGMKRMPENLSLKSLPGWRA